MSACALALLLLLATGRCSFISNLSAAHVPPSFYNPREKKCTQWDGLTLNTTYPIGGGIFSLLVQRKKLISMPKNKGSVLPT